ncbi:hypothetical protein ABPG74_016836 [Tetrahymena malaccensis]
MMQRFIFLLAILLNLLENINGLPFNFTHRANLTVYVDGQNRGDLAIGLYGHEAPKAVMNFLSQCESRKEHKNLENILKLNLTDIENKFSFTNKAIYKMFDTHMQFGDYFSEKNNWKGNVTIFGGSYYSEINDYETEIGALAQERLEENGHVGSEYTIFLKKASFDGRQSLWHVFGVVYQNLDLLKYLFYTASENDGTPQRSVKIMNCKITQYK